MRLPFRFNPSSASSQSLPQRWKRGRQRVALSAMAFLTLFTGALHEQGGADQLGSWWLRARFSLREWLSNSLQGPQRDPRIALIEIDDKSIARWRQLDIERLEQGKPAIGNELSMSWGGHIAGAVEQLNRSGARLVALDWTQTIETDGLRGWKNDERLGRALSEANKVVFVKFIGSNGDYVLPAASLLNSARGAYGPLGQDNRENLLGFADLLSSDNVQTTFFPEAPAKNDGSPEVSFAARVARNSGLMRSPMPSPRRDGSLLINYRNNVGRGAFERASLADVAEATVADPRWKDKIVLIGSSYKGSNDYLNVPFIEGFSLTGTRKIPGVEVQASAVATLLDADAIAEPEGAAVWLISVLAGGLGVGAFALWSWGRAARMLGLLLVCWTVLSFTLFCAAHYSLPLVLPFTSLIIGAAIMGGYRALSEERERAQVMKVWGRYQDPRLIQEALNHPEWRSGEGRELEVTVLFADLKNFTQTVEALPPTRAIEALNRYLSLLSQTILKHGGVVDKYLGDGLMAQWGAPSERPDHATAAVQACLDIEKQVGCLTRELDAAGEVSFEVRLTLHSGPVVAGPLGADERLEYTIIGDTVNVTSRLQETAKALGCDFLISETTCAALDGAVRTGRETEVGIRGRQAPLRVFEVLGDEVHPHQMAKISQNTEIP